MKKILLGICLLMSVTSCSDFLDNESYTDKNMGNFPLNPADVDAMITGVSATQGNSLALSKNHPYIVGEAAADERFGGAGASTYDMQALDKMMVSSTNQFSEIWQNRYKGIYRANQVLENIDDCPGFDDESQRDTYKGEALFLRAIYYWDLVQLFERVPLVLKTDPENLPRATVEELYAQMGSDLVAAIDLLPNKPYSSYDPGRATRWNAEGFLARIYMFYTGFYENDLNAGMPLVDGGELTKSQMVSYLQDCIDNSGHDLVDKFGNLWTYSNEHTKKDYKYAQDNDLSWAGEDNIEVMYSYKYSTNGANLATQRNMFASWECLASSNLDREATFPYGQGWCFGNVNKKTWDYWQANNPDDPRKMGTFIDLENEIPGFNPNGFKSWEETMYRSKKFMAITAKDSDGTVQHCFSVLEWGVANTAKSFIFDFVLMRFAEILLMQAELTEDASYINRVRTRAGMPSVAYTTDNLRDERRWELSFEGQRWNDIRRWHIAEQVLGAQEGETVYNSAVEATVPALGGGYVARYKATNGFWMIPTTQIDLSSGVLDQNPGWSNGDNFEYSGWK